MTEGRNAAGQRTIKRSTGMRNIEMIRANEALRIAESANSRVTYWIFATPSLERIFTDIRLAASHGKTSLLYRVSMYAKKEDFAYLNPLTELGYIVNLESPNLHITWARKEKQ